MFGLSDIANLVEWSDELDQNTLTMVQSFFVSALSIDTNTTVAIDTDVTLAIDTKVTVAIDARDRPVRNSFLKYNICFKYLWFIPEHNLD